MSQFSEFSEHNISSQASGIRLLEKDVIEQIAAGEVIERPSHLIKEIIENSLDAGSTQIEIDFSQGGRALCVRDNGVGMSKEDLPMALTRHATSKISNADDLFKLKSFGFRGEALASIAAVSKLTLSSRTKHQESGYVLESEFGKSDGVRENSQDVGTEIRLNSLFQNLPARLKFLKSEASEHSQIKRIIKSQALLWPGVSFKVRQNGEMICLWPATSAEQRVHDVMGIELRKVEGSHLGNQVTLHYSSPMDVERSSQQIWIFVQKRWVQDKAIHAAVMDAYRNLLMHGEFPSVVVDLTVPPQEVDVNIHPTKSQVKFVQTSLIYKLVQSTLRADLEKSVAQRPRVVMENQLATGSLLGDYFDQVHFKKVPSPATNFEVGNSLSAKLENSTMPLNQILSQGPNLDQKLAPPTQVQDSSITQETQTSVIAKFWSNLEIVGQAQQAYILAQSREALYIVDQHAAHERIVFERLSESYQKNKLEIQNFLIPQILSLDLEATESLLSIKPDLMKMGFEVDAMGPEQVIIRSAPALLPPSAVEKALSQLAYEKARRGESFALEKIISDIFASMACHSVIRAGQSLSFEEMKGLLAQMDEFAFSSFCPHGRPVFLEKSFFQIEKEFGRRK